MESTETISQSPRRRASCERRLRLARGGDADEGDCGQAPATGMRTRCRGRAVTSSSTAREVVRMAGGHGHAAQGARRRRRRPAPAAGKWTSFPWRVRPLSMASSRRLTPSTSTSSRAADPGLVAGQRGTVDHRLEPLEALGDDVGGRRIATPWPAARVPGRGEKMKVNARVVPGLGADGERVLEVLLGLTGEPDDDVGRHGQVVDGGAGRGQPLEVALRPCSPAAWRAAPCRSPTAGEGGAARTPRASRPWPRSSRAAGPWGAGW